MKFLVKSRRRMRDYIAVHYRNKRIAKRMGIREGEVWVREDWWRDPVKRKRILTHEKVELNLMDRGVPYSRAHRIANRFERNMLRRMKKVKK